MNESTASIDKFYGSGELQETILSSLSQAGKEINSLTVDDLAPIDEFHTRGRLSTLEVAELSDIQEHDLVLEVGCGLGGTARHLAHRYKCRVIGIDITEEYIAVGKELTHLVGLTDHVELLHGNALAIPYEDETFDIVWTEHAQMNIEDKHRFYSEISRVLKPRGRLFFHDIFQGLTGPAHYPVPWADEPPMSHLMTEKEAHKVIVEAGLEIDHWLQKTKESIEFFREVLGKIEENGYPALGIHLLMGRNAKTKLMNYSRSLQENRVVVALGAAHRALQ